MAARSDDGPEDLPQHRAIAVHRLGERLARHFAAGAVKQLLSDHRCAIARARQLSRRIARLTLQELTLAISLTLHLQGICRFTALWHRPIGGGFGRPPVTTRTPP